MLNIKLQMTKTPRIRVDLDRVMAYSKGNCVTTTLNDSNSHFSRKIEKIFLKNVEKLKNLKLKKESIKAP